MSQRDTATQDGSQFEGDGVDAMISRAFMRGAGHSAEQVRRRPVIGICSSYSELNPCNAGLNSLAEAVKRGVTAAGGFPLVFPTISVSEPFSRPTSMHLRNLMSMDVEQMLRASPLDAVVLLGGCDKTVPAQLMGAISADVPSVVVTAGPRPSGRWRGGQLSIDDMWRLKDERRAGQIDDAEWSELEGCLIPGVGTCNVMGTAVSMAMVTEVLGLALPHSSLPPSGSAERLDIAERSGERAVALVQEGAPGAAAHVTEAALRTACRLICAVGGSTNVLIHLQAIAGRAGILLTPSKLAEWCRGVEALADVRPTGRFDLDELQVAGGVPAVLGRLGPLVDQHLVAGDGRAWAEHCKAVPEQTSDVLCSPRGRPDAISVLTGTLAPDGAVIKSVSASAELSRHTGPAVVFNSVEDLNARIDDESLAITPESVIVLRGEGPVGGPGMPEVGHLPIPTYLLNQGIRDMVRISDARMSGTATGTVVLHVTPESAVGGPLSLVRDGDLILLDISEGRLDLLVSSEDLELRRPEPPPRPRPVRGYDRLYVDSVLPASAGCDFDFLVDPRASAPQDHTAMTELREGIR